MFFLLIYWDCNSVFLLAAVAAPTGPKKPPRLPATRRGGLIKEIYFQFQAPAQAKSNSLLASFTLDAHFPF